MIQNVVIISDFCYVEGGASKVAIDSAEGLAKRGYHVFFLTPSLSKMSALSDKVVLVSSEQGECLKYKNKIAGLFNQVKNKKFYHLVCNELSKLDNKNTVVHVHSWTKCCSAYFFKAIEKLGFRCFLTLHDYFKICPNGALFNFRKCKCCRLKPGSLRCILSNCDSRNFLYKVVRILRHSSYKKWIRGNYLSIICVSSFQRKLLPGVSANILENPVDIPNAFCAQKEYDFAFVGRTDREKGFDLFLRAAQKYPGHRFILIGKTKDVLPSNVDSSGWVSEDKVNDLLSRCKSIILPSLWPETFGLNAVKAAAMGIAVIVSNNTASAELIREYEKAFIFNQGDFFSMETKINEFLRASYSSEKYAYKNEYFEKLDRLYQNGI